jgi:hypothetical protein
VKSSITLPLNIEEDTGESCNMKNVKELDFRLILTRYKPSNKKERTSKNKSFIDKKNFNDFCFRDQFKGSTKLIFQVKIFSIRSNHKRTLIRLEKP